MTQTKKELIKSLETERADGHVELHLMAPRDDDPCRTLVMIESGSISEVEDVRPSEIPSAISKMIARAAMRSSVGKFFNQKKRVRKWM
jgi:hypothetical protein